MCGRRSRITDLGDPAVFVPVNFLDFALRFPFVIAALRTSHEGHELTALDQAGRGARPGRRRR